MFLSVDDCNGVIAGLSTAFVVTIILVITFFAFLLYRKKSCNPYRYNDDCEESRVNESTESREATPEVSDVPDLEEMTNAEKRHSSLKRSSAFPKEEIKPLIPSSKLNLHMHDANSFTFHIKNLS